MYSLDSALRRAQPGRATLAPKAPLLARLKARLFGLVVLALLAALLIYPWYC